LKALYLISLKGPFSTQFSPLIPYKLPHIISLSVRTYSETSNKNNLGNIVLNYFLTTLQTTKEIKPKIVLSKQAKLASDILIIMINSLEEISNLKFKSKSTNLQNLGDNKLFYFITEYYKLPILVGPLIKEIEGRLCSQYESSLPLNNRNYPFFSETSRHMPDGGNTHILNNKFNESGLYIFRHDTGKIALGSAMNFQRRLNDHISSFNNHRLQESLHKFAQDNGGMSSFTWGPLVITPNFYKLFLSHNPSYILSKGEIQILTALTQFMPRVLEQAYIDHYKPELNGNKKKNYQVVFNFLKWDSSSLYSPISGNYLDSPKYIAKDELNKIVASSNTMNGLASLLGLSLQGLKYHLNRESVVLAKSLGLSVSLQEKNVTPKGSPIEYYKTKKVNRPELQLSKDLSSLEMGNILIYALDKETVVAKNLSAPLVFKYLNPNLSLNLTSKELKVKADNMATYINKECIYSSELGDYYLAKNPNYAINTKSSIIIININTYHAIICDSKRECTRILSELTYKNIQLGTLSRNNWLDLRRAGLLLIIMRIITYY
jgi:hypothetical protein